jgi:hypothetical protein
MYFATHFMYLFYTHMHNYKVTVFWTLYYTSLYLYQVINLQLEIEG